MLSFLIESSRLEERGPAFTFRVEKDNQIYPAFAVRAEGVVRAYLNVCAHVGLPLDGRRGNFWYLEGTYLGCVQHGALYQPDTGHCIRGPCEGLSLISLSTQEQEAKVFLTSKEYRLVIC